jgi:hypothetical protein
MATNHTTLPRARWATIIPTAAPFAVDGFITALVALFGER